MRTALRETSNQLLGEREKLEPQLVDIQSLMIELHVPSSAGEWSTLCGHGHGRGRVRNEGISQERTQNVVRP